MEIKKLRKQVRQAVADYMLTEGCDCCRQNDEHELNAEKLAKLLNVTKYKDGAGYEFSKYRSR